MSILCQICNKKPTCKKLCNEVKKYLKDQGIYSADWIRPEVSRKVRSSSNRYREIPMSNLRKEDKRRVENMLGKGYWSD